MAKCCGEIMSGEDISRSWQNGLYQNYQSDSIHCISDLLLASQIVRNESDFFYFDFNLLLACFFSRPLSCCRIDGRQMQQLKWLPQWLWPRYEFGECRINRHKHVKRWKFWNIPLKKSKCTMFPIFWCARLTFDSRRHLTFVSLGGWQMCLTVGNAVVGATTPNAITQNFVATTECIDEIFILSWEILSCVGCCYAEFFPRRTCVSVWRVEKIATTLLES